MSLFFLLHGWIPSGQTLYVLDGSVNLYFRECLIPRLRAAACCVFLDWLRFFACLDHDLLYQYVFFFFPPPAIFRWIPGLFLNPTLVFCVLA